MITLAGWQLRVFGRTDTIRNLLTGGILLGLAFVAIQGIEWVRLLGFGLKSEASLYGAFFYLIIGAHGLHVVAGIIILLYLFFSVGRINLHEEKLNRFRICSAYWYFVTGVWPLLYYFVYLS
jgi:heme/copper-type cytochrome/quinol oxidase subunit 3